MNWRKALKYVIPYFVIIGIYFTFMSKEKDWSALATCVSIFIILSGLFSYDLYKEKEKYDEFRFYLKNFLIDFFRVGISSYVILWLLGHTFWDKIFSFSISIGYVMAHFKKKK